MGSVVILGVFVADTSFRADRAPRMGETVLGKSFALGPGGKGSNQAVACARLGAETHFISKLGRDDFGQIALSTWKDAGVTAHAPQISDSYTGAAYIFIEEATGDNAIIIAPGAAAKITPADLDANAALIEAADVFITQLEQPLEAARRGLEIARAAKTTTILNPAPAAPLTDDVLTLCDYITPNETETTELTGLPVETLDEAKIAAAALRDKGVGTPIITLGARGAYLDGHGLIPAVSAGPVVETTGAGDAFNGGFAAALSRGADPVEAVKFGCATAGISVTRAGAAASMPSKQDVESLISGL
jgi:ribokinase